MHGGYKTALCKNFMQNGNCPFDKQCNYAHGPMEIRSYPMSRSMHPSQMHYSDPIPRRKESDIYHPKYKTSLCASVINGTECTKGTLHLCFNFQVQNSIKKCKIDFQEECVFSRILEVNYEHPEKVVGQVRKCQRSYHLTFRKGWTENSDTK